MLSKHSQNVLNQNALKTFTKRFQQNFQAKHLQNVLKQNALKTFSIKTLSKRSQSKRFQNALKTFTKRFQQNVHCTLAFPLWFHPLVIGFERVIKVTDDT
jgi:ribosomal protein S20